MKKATLRDMARTLGITVATVSRALKDYPDISADTKARVLATARQLNYSPNAMAVKLRQKQFSIVGMIIPEIVHPFFSSVISGVIDVADQYDYHVMLTQSNESYAKEIRETRMLHATGVDGLLVCLSNETVAVDHLRALQEVNIPVVLFDKVSPDLVASKVICNDFQGAFEATAHLLAQGLTRVAHIRGPEHPENAKQRLAGYRAALEAYGLPFRPEYVRQCAHVTQEEGYWFTYELLALPEPPQAIFTITDLVAVGAMLAIKKHGLRIPEDVALIGFSDWHVSTVMEPPISSVSQPAFEMGQRAMHMLLREMSEQQHDEPVTHQTLVLDTSMRIRQSSVLVPMVGETGSSPLSSWQTV
ncbi:MAG: LacI family DNA-binding transcriptional regulator [Hymenobacter sp.]|nr:LacI family DNA-binding transcriptional regulator [Hymenobacter sp.]